MSEPIKLSHSAVEKFNTCAFEYKMHYIEKIRTLEMNSALLFGSAIDRSCENYIQNRNPGQARLIFKNNWKEQVFNDELIELSQSTKINYRDADLDLELLLESDHLSILKDTLFTSVSDLIKEGTDTKRIKYTYWISLYRKGRFLVNKWIEWVDENIEEVLGCQVPIEFEDELGNKIIGFADFVVKIKGYDKPIVLDLKTSAMYYKRDSVKESKQLALYFQYLREFHPTMERAGFVVLQKNIKKNREKICLICGYNGSGKNHKTCPNEDVTGERCNGDYSIKVFPEAVIQYIHDEIPEDFIASTLDGYNIVQKKIRDKEFPQNFDACTRYNGKVICPYYEYCRSGSMCGLFKKDN